MGAEERYEYTTFPSRKTTFPLFAEEVGGGWLQLLNLVMHCGTVKGAGKGGRLTEILNAIVTVKLTSDEVLPPCFDIGINEFEAYYRRSFSLPSPKGVDYTCGGRLRDWSWFDLMDEYMETEALKVFQACIAWMSGAAGQFEGQAIPAIDSVWWGMIYFRWIHPRPVVVTACPA
jgi:hypothetical protein